MVDLDGSTVLYCEENERLERILPVNSGHGRNWTHTMRRSMQEIVPGVYLGPYSSASKSHLESLLNHGITHIVCVRQDNEAHFIRPNFLDTFQYLVLDLADSIYESIIPYFSQVRKFLQECRQQGGKVLIHGNTGISRSAALVLAYIMEEYCLTYEEAFKIVREKRYCINPNIGFISQLQEFEPIIRAQRTSQLGQTSSSVNQRANKRRRSDHDDDNSNLDECSIPIPPPPSPVNIGPSSPQSNCSQHNFNESMEIGFCT